MRHAAASLINSEY